MAREYTREIYLYINGKQINNDIKSIRAEMQLLVNEQARMIVGSKEYVAHGEKIRSLKGIMNEHALQLKNMNRSWKETAGAMGDWFNRYQAFAVAAVASIVGVVMAFRKTSEASMLMEERLDNLSALTGLTGRSLEWLGQKAKDSSVSITETGIRIKQSATDIVDAYTKIGSQRPELLKNKEALAKVTEAAIILSEAAKSKLEPATLALTTTMNQFNLGASEVNRIINVLGAGALVGAGEIPYLTEVLEKSGTTANLMGISIEQMTGIIEGIAPKFQMAEVAGTALDRVFLELRKRGIGFKDGVFDINRAIDELGARYKSGESAVKIFGVHQAKMGEVLVMNRDAINRFTEGVTGTKVAFEQAGKNTDNMAAKLAQAKNKVTLMYIEVGEKLAPAMIFSTNALNIFLRTLMALPKVISENRVLIVSLAGAVLAYNGALIASIAVTVWERTAKLLSIKSTSLQILMTEAQTAQIAKLTIVQKAAVVTQWLLNAAMAANPVGLVIAGVTALVAASMIYARNSKEALAIEVRKKELVDSLTTSNQELSASYDMLSEDQDKLNRMSVDQKRELAQQLDATIKLAEANYDLQKSKRGELRADNTQLNAWQFLTTWSNSGKLEKARANGLKAVEDIDAGLAKSADLIQSMKDQKLTLADILTSEATGDKIGTESIVMMEEKLERYSLALNNAKIGTEEYIRLQKKVAAVDADLKKARGSNLDVGDENFKRKEALADIEEFHTKQLALIKSQYAKGEIAKDYYLDLLDQEEIRFQTASITRLKAHGQATVDEEEKIQTVLVGMREAKDKQQEELMKSLDDQEKEMFKAWDDEYEKFTKNFEGADPHWTDSEKQKMLEWQYWLATNAEGQKAKLDSDLANNLISLSEYHDKVRALDKETTEKKFQQLEDFARGSNTILDAINTMNEAYKNKELATAGLNDKQKEAIEKKYALRQQKLAIAQTIMEGILEVARVNSNVGVNADLTQTLRLMLTGAAVARTIAGVALIQSQQFDKGRYPVVSNDGTSSDSDVFIPLPGFPVPQSRQFAEGKYPNVSNDGTIPGTNPIVLTSGLSVPTFPQFAEGQYPDVSNDLAAPGSNPIIPPSGLPAPQLPQFAAGQYPGVSIDIAAPNANPIPPISGLPAPLLPQFEAGQYPDVSIDIATPNANQIPPISGLAVPQLPQFEAGQYPGVSKDGAIPGANPIPPKAGSTVPQSPLFQLTRLLEFLKVDSEVIIQSPPVSPEIPLPGSKQYARGKYPVMGADDKRIYQATILGKVRTGLYKTPTLGLFSEKEPEIVIDGPTTRRIRANFPQILNAIQSVRVNQYATGMYPDPGGNVSPASVDFASKIQTKNSPDIASTASDTSIQIAALLQTNIQMMRQVILSHEKPGTVSFKSIRDTQAEFDFIKSKTTLS